MTGESLSIDGSNLSWAKVAARVTHSNMKKTSLALVSALLFGLSGCIPTSLNPLTGQDLVFDPALIGVWRGEGNAKETWAFEKAGDKEYKFVYTEEDGKAGQFEAHLLKLGNTQFLDFFPDESGIEEMNRSGFYKVHLLRTHSFLKVTRIEPALQMAPLDLKWLREFLGKNPKAVRHHEVGEGDDAQIVLTDSTPELRKFVENHLKTAGAFGEPIHLKRTRNQVAEVSELRPSRRHQRMNGSKRCGPSGDERTSREAPTRFAQRASPF